MAYRLTIEEMSARGREREREREGLQSWTEAWLTVVLGVS
jgi:hypothetical protein